MVAKFDFYEKLKMGAERSNRRVLNRDAVVDSSLKIGSTVSGHLVLRWARADTGK